MKGVLKNKFYLYMTEFFSGVAVMAVELGASRLLAPYFSSSQIVWTIIIGTIMIAMALGNIYGGRSADKNPDPDRLYRRILIAAVWIAAIPVLGKYVILLITGVLVIAINSNFLIWAAFLACMIIFVFPLFLLGTVTPSLARYTVSSLDSSGRTVGTLGAANTIGSIIGTFLPTFVTIPSVGTSVTFLLFSGILLAIGLVYFISVRRRRILCLVCTVLFVVFSFFGHSGRFAFWDNTLAYEGESVYNYLQVRETPDSMILSTNVLFGVQSVMMKEHGLTGMYYDYAMAAPVMAGFSDTGSTEGTVCDMLILGMGTGTYARQCLQYFGEMHIDGVEIDEKITALAKTYFDEPEEARVTTYDGRAYLQADTRKYDVIMVDAYQDITIPFQMSSTEFFTLVRDHLKENGVMVVNLNMHSNRNGAINMALADTISAVFDHVYTVEVPGNSNQELFASCGNVTAETLRANCRTVEDPELSALLGRVLDGLDAYEAGSQILTDDKAPVEVLGMRMIDDMIFEELGYYKTIVRERGVSGLLEAF